MVVDRRSILKSSGGQAAIVRRWLSGETLKSIATSFGYANSQKIKSVIDTFIFAYGEERMVQKTYGLGARGGTPGTSFLAQEVLRGKPGASIALRNWADGLPTRFERHQAEKASDG